MANKIAGFLGVTIVLVFLGIYIYKVPSIPLGVIMFCVMVMILVDFYDSLVTEDGDEGN